VICNQQIIKRPFKISNNPSWHERYFYWIFSKDGTYMDILKFVLIVPSLFMIIALYPWVITFGGPHQ
jgi:hypothetical protein